MTTHEPSHDPSLASREAVLQAAQDLLLQHGYAGLSMRELARQSGLAKGTIYHHFQDKRSIYLTVLERDLAIARERIQAAAAGEGEAQTRLRRVIHTYFELHQERRLLIMTAMREAIRQEADLWALIRRYRDELSQPIAALFAEAIAAGVMRPVQVEMAVTSLFGLLHGFVAHCVLLDDGGIGDDVVEHILDLMLHGLLAADDTAPPMHNTSAA